MKRSSFGEATLVSSRAHAASMMRSSSSFVLGIGFTVARVVLGRPIVRYDAPRSRSSSAMNRAIRAALPPSCL